MKITLALLLSSILICMTAACNFPSSNPQIDYAYLSSDPEGNQQKITFSPNETFYLLIQLTHASKNTHLKAEWSTIEVEGYPSNFVIGETELISGNGVYHFNLENEGPWPSGLYKVDLLLDEEPAMTLEFKVE